MHSLVIAGGEVVLGCSFADPSSPSLLLYTDVSLSGWGGHLLDLTTAGVWSQEEQVLHINIMEMGVVILALNAFLHQAAGQSFILMSDNTTVVVYLRKQGGTVSRVRCDLACKAVLWTEIHSVNLSARYILGKKNILADQLSRPDQVLPMEWFFLLRVFEAICRVFGRPHLDLFAMRTSSRTHGVEAGCLSASLGPPQHIHLSPLHSHQAGLIKSSTFDQAFVDSSGSVLASERMVRRSVISAS